MPLFYVKPERGKRVPNPDTGVPLPVEGAQVPKNQYWLRRLQDGDIVVTETRKKPSKKAVSE